MYRRKKLDHKYYIIIIFIVAVFFLGILYFVIQDKRNLSFPEKIVKDTILLIEKVVYTPVRLITDQVKEFKEKNKLYDQYSKMKESYEKAGVTEAKLQDAKVEVRKLQETLELNQTLQEYEFVNATIISRNLDTWYQTVTIDKGSNSGIEEGMAVIIDTGLIGRIIRTSHLTSTAKLLTSVDSNQKISTKIESGENYIYGLLIDYDEKKHVYTMEGISENTEIVTGANVVTTGLGNAFPSGILIGRVQKVTTDNFELSRTVEIEPSVDFNDVRYVTVLKRKIN